MTRTMVSRGNRTAGRSRRNGANPFSPLRQENREVTFPPPSGGETIVTRRALARSLRALYRIPVQFAIQPQDPCLPNSSLRPSPPPPSLCSPPTPPPPVWRGYTCVRLHLQPPTCAIPSAIGNSQRRRRRRFIAPSLRPSFRLPRANQPPASPSLLPRPPTISYCFFFSFSSWIPREDARPANLTGNGLHDERAERSQQSARVIG